MIAYVKRNMVAFVALFVAIILSGGTAAYAANTIRSSDIVDGQVQNADIAANAVGNGKIQDGSVLGADIKDDALSGNDIKESTLGLVPNAKHAQSADSAASLGGVPLDALRQRTVTNHVPTDSCIQPLHWDQCAPITVVIPAGHTYVVTIWSSVTVSEGGTAQGVEYCPAFNVPTCLDGAPEVMTLQPNTFTNGSTSATANFGPGTYTFSTAEFFETAPDPSGNAKSVTTVEYHDLQAEGLP